MPSTFAVSTPTPTVPLSPNRIGEVPFTVTNTSGSALHGRGTPVPAAPMPAEWLSIEGDIERDFPAGSSSAFVVRVEPPLGVAAGTYDFRLDVNGVEHPDQDYTEGPTCEIQVPPSSATHITTPRGYVATMVGATIGGFLGELILVVIAPFVIRHIANSKSTSTCTGSALGCAIGEAFGKALAAALLLGLIGVVAFFLGSTFGAAISLRVKKYLGSKTTALFLGILMIPWSIVALFVLGHITHSGLVAAILAPFFMMSAPALVARGAVLLIRTHHI